MKDIETLFCENIYKFMVKHKNEIVEKHIINNGFKSKKEFFEKIRSDFQDAAWCLCELLNWGMRDGDMDKQFIYENDIVSNVDGQYNEEVYIMMNNETPVYFKLYLDYNKETNNYNYRISEVKKQKKIIEVEVWENY